MIRKRLVGVVTVKDGWAVQSFGYGRWLPLGRPEVLTENLDRWGADEIVLQCIDRSAQRRGPDLQLLERVSKKGLSTPLIYAGGIRSADDAVAAVKSGADRVCVDALLHDDPEALRALSAPLGAQAVIASLPLSLGAQGLAWLDHRTGREQPLATRLVEILRAGVVSEALVIDWRHEGTPGGFDLRLLSAFPVAEMPIIAFGGLSEPAQLRQALQSERVSAVAVGNFLSYREHAIHHYKRALAGLPVRPAAAVAPMRP